MHSVSLATVPPCLWISTTPRSDTVGSRGIKEVVSKYDFAEIRYIFLHSAEICFTFITISCGLCGGVRGVSAAEAEAEGEGDAEVGEDVAVGPEEFGAEEEAGGGLEDGAGTPVEGEAGLGVIEGDGLPCSANEGLVDAAGAVALQAGAGGDEPVGAIAAAPVLKGWGEEDTAQAELRLIAEGRGEGLYIERPAVSEGDGGGASPSGGGTRRAFVAAAAHDSVSAKQFDSARGFGEHGGRGAEEEGKEGFHGNQGSVRC